MTLSSENMRKLMAYADGELEGPESTAERKEAEKLLAGDPDSARFVENITGLGNIIAMGHGARSGNAIAKFDVADAVMASVKAEKPASNVVSLVSRPPARARSEKSEKKGRGLQVAGGFAAVLALAASVFLFAQHRTEETPMAKAPITQPSPGHASPSSDSSEPVGAGVDVRTLNSPGNSVSVFYLPTTANEMASSLVVWVDETGEK